MCNGGGSRSQINRNSGGDRANMREVVSQARKGKELPNHLPRARPNPAPIPRARPMPIPQLPRARPNIAGPLPRMRPNPDQYYEDDRGDTGTMYLPQFSEDSRGNTGQMMLPASLMEDPRGNTGEMDLGSMLDQRMDANSSNKAALLQSILQAKARDAAMAARPTIDQMPLDPDMLRRMSQDNGDS